MHKWLFNWRPIAGLLILLLLSGCASQPTLYRWGDYDSQLYSHLQNTGSLAQQIAALEKTLNTGNQARNPGPGLHAHLGLLYGKSGREDLMHKHWEAEKLLYPESAPYLDFLLQRAKTKNSGGRQ